MMIYLHFVLLLAIITLCYFSLSAECRLFEPQSHRHHRSRSKISTPPSPAPEAATHMIFSVLSYGAVGNGVADDTLPFKKAWNAACLAAYPAVMLVPGHYTFMIQSFIFSGPCKNPLIFQIEGGLMAPDGPHSWPKNNSKRQWLVFYKIDGMSMQGGGTIDGRGQKWWDLPCKPHRGPKGKTVAGPCDSPVCKE